MSETAKSITPQNQQTSVVPATPATLLAMAVQQGADLDKLERLMDLQAKWEANEARKAFVTAMAAFKSNPPTITKDKHVKYGQTEYDHATLDHVSSAIGEALSRHGLSHRWDVQQSDGLIKVSCIITHVLGHSESTTMQSGADSSGGKNSIQAIGSAVTYLQRYSLLAAVGLAAGEQDDDAIDAQVEYITASQAADLLALAEEVKADLPKFLAFMGVDSMEGIAVPDYQRALAALEKKRKAAS